MATEIVYLAAELLVTEMSFSTNLSESAGCSFVEARTATFTIGMPAAPILREKPTSISFSPPEKGEKLRLGRFDTCASHFRRIGRRSSHFPRKLRIRLPAGLPLQM